MRKKLLHETTDVKCICLHLTVNGVRPSERKLALLHYSVNN